MNVSDESKSEEAVQKYFIYLKQQYGCMYTPYTYQSEKVKLVVNIGHKSPRLLIYRLGEPEFTKLVFERIVQYFERRLDIDDLFRYFPDYPLEDNVRFVANLFQGYAQRIITDIDEWWIPVQLFQYKLIEKEYSDAGQLEDFQAGFKDKHDYLQSKGAI